MMLTAGIALALTLAQAQPPSSPKEAPKADETVPVQRGARLTINNFAGEVVIHTWDKDQVHVVARHQGRMKVGIKNSGVAVMITSAPMSGPVGSVDFDITAPSWMPIRTEGTYNFVTVDGAQAEVFANTVRGDVIIKGGTGSITAKSVEGEVDVDGARGKVNVNSVNEKIRITNSSGEITAESVNGSITMTGMEAVSVDASSVNGTITYEGRIADSGHYSFETHNGDLLLGMPENLNATFTIRTYQGSFSTDLPLQGVGRNELQRGRRVTTTLGNGSAEISLETFGGTIRLRRGSASRQRGK
ncbi:MAG TPA: DUF4097 family beta strand repeat-containing protein [Vicinamibacterales bacterium]|nr:DUF4097 family beta strand repeat-containing protein [Vicinamibacterales bacterium]